MARLSIGLTFLFVGVILSVQVSAQAEWVVLTVRFTALAEMLPDLRDHLQGKIVVDCTNPLNPD